MERSFGHAASIALLFLVVMAAWALSLVALVAPAAPAARGAPVLAIAALGALVVAIAMLDRDHRRAEEALARNAKLFEAIVENIPDMIFVKEARELRFVLFNRAGEQLVGYPRDAMLGKNDYDFFPKDQVEFFVSKDREALNGAQVVDIPEEPIDTKAGRRLLHTKKVPIRDAEGRPAYLLGISEDITELRAARQEIDSLNAQLARRIAELEATNEELEAFTYSVSHDLRAPVRAIDGFGHMLQEDYAADLDETGRRYLARVVQGASHLGRLIDDLLELSRVSRRAMVRGQLDLTALAWAVADDLVRAQPQRRVTWTIAPDLVAHGDEGLVRVALANLLGNAWKFTSRQPTARIEVGATTRDGRPAYYVRDDGAGFDPAYADKLFRPFSRLHSEEEFEGTGIGLATVARVVRRHGGEIWAEGTPSGGATIGFTLGEEAS